MRLAGYVARMGGQERCKQGLGEETWGKEPMCGREHIQN